jgi:hypothetical protein
MLAKPGTVTSRMKPRWRDFVAVQHYYREYPVEKLGFSSKFSPSSR